MGDRMEGGKGAENDNLFNKVDKGRESGQEKKTPMQDVTEPTAGVLSEIMVAEPKLYQLVLKFKDLGVENPNIDKLRIILNSLEKRLENEGRSWDQMEELDIKFALFDGKPYDGSQEVFFEGYLKDESFGKIYKLIELEEKSGLKIENIGIFRSIMQLMTEDLEGKLMILEGESFVPKDEFDLWYLKNEIDENWLKEFKEKNQWKEMRFRDLRMKYMEEHTEDKFNLFNGENWAPKSSEDKIKLFYYEKRELWAMIKFARDNPELCNSFNDFMGLRNTVGVEDLLEQMDIKGDPDCLNEK